MSKILICLPNQLNAKLCRDLLIHAGHQQADIIIAGDSEQAMNFLAKYNDGAAGIKTVIADWGNTDAHAHANLFMPNLAMEISGRLKSGRFAGLVPPRIVAINYLGSMPPADEVKSVCVEMIMMRDVLGRPGGMIEPLLAAINRVHDDSMKVTQLPHAPSRPTFQSNEAGAVGDNVIPIGKNLKDGPG